MRQYFVGRLLTLAGSLQAGDYTVDELVVELQAVTKAIAELDD